MSKIVTVTYAKLGDAPFTFHIREEKVARLRPSWEAAGVVVHSVVPFAPTPALVAMLRGAGVDPARLG